LNVKIYTSTSYLIECHGIYQLIQCHGFFCHFYWWKGQVGQFAFHYDQWNGFLQQNPDFTIEILNNLIYSLLINAIIHFPPKTWIPQMTLKSRICQKSKTWTIFLPKNHNLTPRFNFYKESQQCLKLKIKSNLLSKTRTVFMQNSGFKQSN